MFVNLETVIGETDLTAVLRFDKGDIEAFQRDLEALIAALSNEASVMRMSIAAARGVQASIVHRAETSGFPTTYKTSMGGYGPSSAMTVGWQDTLQELRESPRRAGPGTVGFGSRLKLDSIRLSVIRAAGSTSENLSGEGDDRDDSDELTPQARRERAILGRAAMDTMGEDAWQIDPRSTNVLRGRTLTYEDPGGMHDFDSVWQISEFGTGIFASPRKRTEGRTKKPGGGGVWYLNPRTKGGEILGQAGTHWLFGLHDGDARLRADADAAVQAFIEQLQNIVRGLNG
jgi:hypothetical protein